MKTFFEKGYLSTGKNKNIEWGRVRNSSPIGIIFVPPLIGGKLSQQVISFRYLIRRRYDLVSFNFSGHGGSSDKFSLKATIHDTLHMLIHVRGLSQKERLPLFGIASCYSAIPILHAAHTLEEPFKRLVLINAIPKLCLKSVINSFFSYYREEFSPHKSLGKTMEAVGYYIDFLFPGIVKNENYFGVLERRRTSLFRIVSELFTLNPLHGVCLDKTPVLCLYARKDRILDIFDTDFKVNYKNDIRRLCPQTTFHSLDGDHYFSLLMARNEALRSIISFF
jgi:pimeloyl-ACP methyl ester carboxylesterase